MITIGKPKNLLAAILLFMVPFALLAQIAPSSTPLEFYVDKPFYKEIKGFQKQDSLKTPKSKSILFIGSSSFTYWTDVSDYFPGYPIINRGFGGSTLADLLRYQDFIVYPYQPKQVVVYCGENDFGASDTVTVNTVVNRFKQLFWDIRIRLPRVPITYVAMKPSPSRRKLLPKFIEANAQIAAFLSKQKRASFVDVYPKMLNAEGEPMPEIFKSDSLHMNEKGYAIWQSAMKSYLKK